MQSLRCVCGVEFSGAGGDLLTAVELHVAHAHAELLDGYHEANGLAQLHDDVTALLDDAVDGETNSHPESMEVVT